MRRLVYLILIPYFAYLLVMLWGAGKLAQDIEGQLLNMQCIQDCRVEHAGDYNGGQRCRAKC